MIQDKVQAKIISVFKELNPVAIHQFGSVAKGISDQFSDLDIWVTFKDMDLAAVIRNRDQIFKSIAPVLIRHENPVNSPLEGIFSLVIHKTEDGLVEVDYFLSKASQTNILPEAKVLFGDDSLPRGEWILDRAAETNESLEDKIDFLICMAFIGIKMVVRQNKEFLDFLVNKYNQEMNQNLKNNYNFEAVQSILEGLQTQANQQQLPAIEEISKYLNNVSNDK